MLQKNDLARPVKIHICKDRTLSYRRLGEPIFNDVALPVFSVESEQEADDLFLLVGTRQYELHPNPRFKHNETTGWMKLFNRTACDRQYLELDDLDEIADYLRGVYPRITTN